MQRVRKLSNSLIRPILGDQERSHERERDRSRERGPAQRPTDHDDQRGGRARLKRSVSNGSFYKPVDRPGVTRPPRKDEIFYVDVPVNLNYPEYGVPERPKAPMPPREKMEQFYASQERRGYQHLTPGQVSGIPAGPGATLHRSASESRLPTVSAPWLGRTPVYDAEEGRGRRQAESSRARERWRERVPPEWDQTDRYPRTAQDAEFSAGRRRRAEAAAAEKEKPVVTSTGKTPSHPRPSNASVDLTSFAADFVPPSEDYRAPVLMYSPFLPPSSRRPRAEPRTDLRRSTSQMDIPVSVSVFLDEQQREAILNGDAERLAQQRREYPHSRRPSQDLDKPTVPLKVHKKSSSGSISLSSPPVLTSSLGKPPSARRSDEVDRTATDPRAYRTRDASEHSGHRREPRGPPPSTSAQYGERITASPPSRVNDVNAKKDVLDPYARAKSPTTPPRTYVPPHPLTTPPRRLYASPLPVSPPAIERQLSDGSSSASSKSRRTGSIAASSPPRAGMSIPAPRRQNTEPAPVTHSSREHGSSRSPPHATPPREPTRKVSSASVAPRRERDVDRIVIFPTDRFGVPQDKALPDTPSLYTPSDLGPPSPTTKPRCVPLVPPGAGTYSPFRRNPGLDVPLQKMELSPGTHLRELPGAQHTVKVSTPETRFVAGYVAEIVQPPVVRPGHARAKRPAARERSAERRRHERREHESREPAVYAPPSSYRDAEQKRAPAIYAQPQAAKTSAPAGRIYAQPERPVRQIYAPPSNVDHSRAEPATASRPAAGSSLRHKRSDYGGLYYR